MYPFLGSPMNFGAMRFGPQGQMPQMPQQMPMQGQMPQRLTAASLLGMPPSSYASMYGNQAMPITPTQYAPAARPMLPSGGGGLLGPVAPAPVPADPSQRPNFNPNRGGGPAGDRGTGGRGPGRGGGFGGGQGGNTGAGGSRHGGPDRW